MLKNSDDSVRKVTVIFYSNSLTVLLLSNTVENYFKGICSGISERII